MYISCEKNEQVHNWEHVIQILYQTMTYPSIFNLKKYLYIQELIPGPIIWKNHGIDLHCPAPWWSNENPTKLEIREVKKKFCGVMTNKSPLNNYMNY